MPVDRRVDPAGQKLQRRARPKPRKPRNAARKRPLSVELIVDTALNVVAAEGFDALTMRRLAAALDTGPASLYAHVINKADLDELLIGRLCSRMVIPTPDPKLWRAQMLDLTAQVRDEYLRYPGLARAALAVVPMNPETLRISEGMLSILLAGGVVPQTAAWAIDALSLYVDAYCLELSLWLENMSPDPDAGWVVTQETLQRRFDALPDEQFPNTKRYAAELVAGEGHDRFDFALGIMLDGLGGR